MAELSLLNDIVFKIVFGSEANRSLLRALLNALLRLSGKYRILDLEILNPYLGKDRVGDKGVILDVRAKDGQGRQYNIEVQVADHPAYVERALYYLARLFVDQLEKGEPYTWLARTIGISLLDFPLFRDLEDLHSTYRFYDEVHSRTLSDVLEIHFIELSKFRSDKPHELRTPFERWLHVLKFGELYQDQLVSVPEALRAEEGIEMALNEMRRACASDEVREMIELRKKAMRDEATRLERAHLQGLEKGREEGLEKGREEGREEGRRALIETARRMREAGLEMDTILEVTGLSRDELDQK